jgi:hypothetical protein
VNGSLIPCPPGTTTAERSCLTLLRGLWERIWSLVSFVQWSLSERLLLSHGHHNCNKISLPWWEIWCFPPLLFLSSNSYHQAMKLVYLTLLALEYVQLVIIVLKGVKVLSRLSVARISVLKITSTALPGSVLPFPCLMATTPLVGRNRHGSKLTLKCFYLTISSVSICLPFFRTSAQECQYGTYCLNGTIFDCPAGRYGNALGLSSSSCSGACRSGYYCPVGSVQSNQVPCPRGRMGNKEGLTSADCAGPCLNPHDC